MNSGNIKIIGFIVFSGQGVFEILLGRVFLIKYWRARLITS